MPILTSWHFLAVENKKSFVCVMYVDEVKDQELSYSLIHLLPPTCSRNKNGSEWSSTRITTTEITKFLMTYFVMSQK
jgi:hypothetical protein